MNAKGGITMMKRKTTEKTQAAGSYEVLVRITFCKRKAPSDNEGNKGKRVIYRFLIGVTAFLLSNFFGGYVGHVAEPVYEMMDAVFSYAEESISSIVEAVITADREIILHDSNITNDHMEISFEREQIIHR